MLALMLAGGAGAATLTVDASGGADYTRIQDAIDSATAGDTIEVYSGTYSENVIVNKQLNLKGIGMPVVDAGGSGSSITLSSGNSLLEGFTVTNAEDGILIGGSNMMDNNIVKSINASNNGNGIYVTHSSNNNLKDNSVLNNNNGIILNNSDSNLIYNNNLSNINNSIDSGNNTWNTTKTSGTNIVGGSYLAGNFWANPGGTGFSQICSDVNIDGICDEPYVLDGNNIDYLPLSMNLSIDTIQVTNPNANPAVILNDNGRARPPGTNITRLNVTVTGNVASVIIDLTPLGGIRSPMTKISGTDIYSITTNATAGINLTNDLVVNVTDTSGNFNNSTSIPVTVLLRGDIVRDNKIDQKDLLYMRRHLIRLEPSISTFVADIKPAQGDGNVDLKDLLYLRRYLAGLEPLI